MVTRAVVFYVWDDILSTLTCHGCLKSWFLTTWHLHSFYPISCVFVVSTFLDSGRHLCHLPLSIWCGFWLQESSETDSRQKAHASTLRPWVVSERRRWRRPRGWLWRNTMESWPWIFRCSDIAAFFFFHLSSLLLWVLLVPWQLTCAKRKISLFPKWVVSSSQTAKPVTTSKLILVHWRDIFERGGVLEKYLHGHWASLTEPRAAQTKRLGIDTTHLDMIKTNF